MGDGKNEPNRTEPNRTGETGTNESTCGRFVLNETMTMPSLFTLTCR